MCLLWCPWHFPLNTLCLIQVLLVLGTGLPGWCRVPESGNFRERDRAHHYYPARPRQTRTPQTVLQISVERTTFNYAVHQCCTIQYTKQKQIIHSTVNRKKLDQCRNHGGKPKTWSLTINLLWKVFVVCTLWLCYQSRPESETGRYQNGQVAHSAHQEATQASCCTWKWP